MKLTGARKELLEIFFSTKKPLSFENIKDKIRMDKATFYRNILKFEEEFIIQSFESNDKKRYYKMQKSPHTHFICNICNQIEYLNDILDVKIDNYVIQNMVLKGICKECNL